MDQQNITHRCPKSASSAERSRSRLVRAGHTFWNLFNRNRFVIAAASLVWLVMRSGSQPRRLGYPCQQAAAANLGFLAVLFVPGLARRRRRRVGSTWPQVAELATGSVVLAGVLFIAIGVGVEVYSEFTAAWTPGNPAVIPWTAVPPSEQATLAPALLAPSSQEAIVAVNRNLAVTYGSQPYGPGENSAYDLVWQSVVDLNLGPTDNPLQDFVTDMDGNGVVKVLIKPNFVEFYDKNAAGERNPVYVHPAMLRPLVDMVARAGAHQILVGDGSDGTGALYTSKMDPMGYTQAYINQLRDLWPGVNIARVDLNIPKQWSWVKLSTQAGGASAYAGSGYTSMQLQKARDGAAGAYFGATDSHGRSGPGAANCMGSLALADAVLDADVVIDLAKLKVHYLGVNTAALKNWVGITMFSTYNSGQIHGCRVAHNVYGATNYEMQFGNDILWRELVDAHRAVLYHRGQSIQSTAQRRVLCIMDSINCGERYHVPQRPLHRWLHTVMASVDPVAIDAVASRLQRYDFRRISIVNNAHAVSIGSPWPVGTADPGNVRVVGRTDIDASYSHLFAWETAQDPSMTWPDWGQATVLDLEPPTIQSWNRTTLAGSWQLSAEIDGCHVAYFYYGDNSAGMPNTVRLARSGNVFTAVLDGTPQDGLLVAQDEQFNTSRTIVSDRPIIELDRSLIARTASCFQNLSSDTFTIRNIGPSPLNYTVEVDPEAQPWLKVSPAAGTLSGGTQSITVSYVPSVLSPGTHAGTITVHDPESYNLRETLAVELTLQGYVSDFDGDGDVDLEDFGHLQRCLTGEWVPQSDPLCADARLDSDNDVDANDVMLFMQCLSGPGVPAEPCCTR